VITKEADLLALRSMAEDPMNYHQLVPKVLRRLYGGGVLVLSSLLPSPPPSAAAVAANIAGVVVGVPVAS
jgi:hypothetical protein